MPVLLEARALTKRYPGVLALDGVDFALESGEIHALMGENGAGKSTLVKILTGATRPDAGEIRLAGRPLFLASPIDAQRAGISAVHQEVNLVPTLTVAENLVLGREPVGRFFGRIDRREARRRAVAALARLGCALDPDRPLETVSIAERQMVAIARALDVPASVLVLDEPTSSLDARETERLFALLRRLRADGLAIVFITHFLEQVAAIADRITVLRNGRRVATREASAFPRIDLVAAMLGREPETLAPSSARAARTENGPPLFSARRLGRRRSLEPVDLDVRAGEVVGLAGLLGSGRTELARLVAGLDPADQGRIEVDGRAVTIRSPRDAIALGIALAPEDRQAEGIVPELSVRENVILALQGRRGIFRRLSSRRQKEIAERAIADLRIATPDAEKPASELSGGNQQKVILARWLAASPRLLVLDEPTRGIDVGAKADALVRVRRLAEGGLAFVFISAEIEEVVRASDRVVVLRDRRVAGEVAGPAADAGSVMRLIAGEEAAPRE